MNLSNWFEAGDKVKYFNGRNTVIGEIAGVYKLTANGVIIAKIKHSGAFKHYFDANVACYALNKIN